MKPKAHILIVEDKAILYKRLSMALKNENYSVDGFSPSVEKALERLHHKLPDLVLLDIDLEGDRTGIDLGNLLCQTYHIPFIYVTDSDDNETFFEGLKSKHEHYLVKTKPHLDTKQIVRAIQTVLSRKMIEREPIFKEALLCFTDYVENTKNYGHQQVSQVPVPFEEIALITTNSVEKIGETNPQNAKTKYSKLKPNYIRIENWKRKSFYLPMSLSEICTKVPPHFVRINESEIVNIGHQILDGRINGTRIQVGDYICTISKTYKAEVEKRFGMLYQGFR